MKFLVFSDTHGSAGRMLAQTRRWQKAGGVDGVFYLGDGETDADALEHEYPGLPLHRVAGNCDYIRDWPDTGIVLQGGVRILYTHGHRQDVKHTLDVLWEQAHAANAGVAMYGHTHAAHLENRGGVWLFNPGSLTLPRGGPPSYGILTIQDKEPRFELLEV